MNTKNIKSNSEYFEIPDPLYGPPPMNDKVENDNILANVALIILMVIVGVITIINKKLSKTAKITICIVLLIPIIGLILTLCSNL